MKIRAQLPALPRRPITFVTVSRDPSPVASRPGPAIVRYLDECCVKQERILARVAS